MKKIIAVLILGLLISLSLCACVGSDGTDAVKASLQYPVCFEAESGELSFEITVREKGVASAKVISPRTLSGLSLEKNGENIEASYKGMKVPIPEASAKKVFMLSEILDSVIASFENKTYAVENGSDTGSISVAAGDTVCVITYDKTGSILSAEIKCNGKRTVYNITIKQGEESSAQSETSHKNNESEGLASNAEKSG